MNTRDRVTKLIKSFGFLYLVLNCILCLVIAILAIQAYGTTGMSPGLVVFILPLIGIFSGHWMRVGRFEWWRIIIIIISLSISVAILFTAIFITPKMEQVKKDKFETARHVKNLDPEEKKLFIALYVNDAATVRQQIEKGVDVNAKDDIGQTPYDIAKKMGHLKLLEYLQSTGSTSGEDKR